MVDRGLVVTLVLDCCFAATVYRLSQPLVRFLPPVPETDMVDEMDVINSEYRGLSMGDSWLVDQTGYAIIAACAPHEEAREIESDTQYFGALSRYLYLTLKNTGFNERNEDIFNYIYARFRKLDFYQRPVLYGNKKQPFFGYNDLSTTQIRIPAVFRDDKLILEAGLAHGVRCNDDFLLWPLDKQFTNIRSPLSARAITTESLTSLLKLETTLPASKNEDWLVEPRTRHVLRSFPFFLSPALTDIEAWQTTLAEQSLSYDQESACIFQVTLRDGTYIIVDKDSKELSNLPSLEQNLYRPEDVSAILNHLARYEFARTLSNGSITENFRSSFEVTVTTSTGEAFGAGHTIDIQDDGNFSSIITLEVENKGRGHLFVYSFVLDPFWQIENGLKTDYEELPPSNTTEGFSGRFSKKLRTEVPEAMINAGLQECTDVLMVLVTKQATSFSILELPPIGEVLRRRAPDRGSSFPTGGLRDWAVFHFPIRTSLKPSSELML
jgi:hypothetical protein